MTKGNVAKRGDAAAGGYAVGGHTAGEHATGCCCDANQKPRSHDTSRIAWDKLMARVGDEFPLACPTCGGDIRLIAFKLFYQCETIPGLRTVGNLRLLRTSCPRSGADSEKSLIHGCLRLQKSAAFSSPATAAGELPGLGQRRRVAFQQIDAAACQPLGQRHAEMTSTAVGPPLVEFQYHRADRHVSHMPHWPVFERGDFHHETFREKRRQGRHPKAPPLP
jgi:hypothetical protein